MDNPIKKKRKQNHESQSLVTQCQKDDIEKKNSILKIEAHKRPKLNEDNSWNTWSRLLDHDYHIKRNTWKIMKKNS